MREKLKNIKLSTDQVSPNNRLEFWRNAIFDYLSHSEIVPDENEILTCSIIAKSIGGIVFLDSSSSAFSTSRGPRDIRADGRNDLTVGFLRRGEVQSEQDGRRVIRRPGTFQISDLTRPYNGKHGPNHQISGFSIPRETIEKNFGNAKNFTLLQIDESFGSKTVIDFFVSLFDNIDNMTPESASQMAAVGTELVLGALSRRLSIETPIRQSMALLLFRAKSYAVANISNTSLSPSEIAGAVGISLRHLQILFQRQATSPSEWIWSTRVALAKDRLISPSYINFTISEIAFTCGFQELSHFSKRFKGEYGISPRDWREQHANITT